MPVSVIIQLSPPQQPLSLSAVLTVIGLLKSMGPICIVRQGVWLSTPARLSPGVPPLVSAARVQAVLAAHGGVPTTAWRRHPIRLALGNGIWFPFRMRAKIIWNRLDIRAHPSFPVKVGQFRHHLPQR